ncbi:MAG TPA: prephenate/arogenate dehydrogenase family protein [Stellaceae bacterium]|nr:prephenate/arogenate dehydrogenase family protein [Stellaceae bacterium]
MTDTPFERVAIVGFGLIGSSMARALRQTGLARRIIGADSDPAVLGTVRDLDLADETTADMAVAVRGADLVVLATPIGSFREIGAAIGPHLAPGAIVTDTGSVKQAIIRDLAPHIPESVHLVPGHPIAGTEHSGPGAGFAELFHGRWCILTPLPQTDRPSVERIAAMWRRFGMSLVEMDPVRHDKVLAITSHLPHLIAYTIVGTAIDLEDSLQSEVIKFSAGGFRDFTRIAASDPIMWRDIFLNNREAVLEMLQRMTEDLVALQRAIRWGEGDKLQDLFSRARAVRRGVIDAHQDK